MEYLQKRYFHIDIYVGLFSPASGCLNCPVHHSLTSTPAIIHHSMVPGTHVMVVCLDLPLFHHCENVTVLHCVIEDTRFQPGAIKAYSIIIR